MDCHGLNKNGSGVTHKLQTWTKFFFPFLVICLTGSHELFTFDDIITTQIVTEFSKHKPRMTKFRDFLILG